MQEHNLFKIFTEKLNKLNIPYMITGSVASIVYGEPRLTHDIDIVLILPQNKIEEFLKAFPNEEFYCPPIEILRIEAAKDNRGHCNILHHNTGFKADIYFAGRDEFQNWALKNTKTLEFMGENLRLAPIEYVIIKKLEYYKEGKSQKHLVDIKSIIVNSEEDINWELLKQIIDKYGLNNEWNLCLEK